MNKRNLRSVRGAVYTVSGKHYVIRDVSSASGGVSYDREEIEEHSINQGRGKEREYKTSKRVDHVQLCKKGDALVSQARYVLRKHCASTVLGAICDESVLVTVMREVDALRTEGRAFNAEAEANRCARRVRIGVVPIRLEVDNALAAKEISRTVRETLGELRDRLTDCDGDLKKVRPVWLRCKNLDRLAAGMCKFAVQDALACAKNAREEIKTAAKSNRDPVLELEAIESAIGMFVDLDEVSGPFELEAVA